MSDFVQVMKDWRRMCVARIKLYGHDFCKGCSLENFRCPAIYNIEVDTDYSIVEREVSAWVAEHPVVYPTWGEYLCDIGLIDVCMSEKEAIDRIFFNTISPDTAEKLGVKPKEE